MSRKYRVKGYDFLSLLSAKRSIKENMNGDDDNDDDDTIVISSAVLAVFLLVNLALWVWALVALLKRQNSSNPLNTTALIFAILGLVGFIVPGGPLLTLILVYAVK